MEIITANQRVLFAVMSSGRPLPFRAADGSAPLIVALPGDDLSTTLERVRSIGGAANVAVASTKNFKIVVLTAKDESAADVGEEYSDDMSMGMFMIRTSGRRGKRAFRLSGVRAGLSSAPSDALAYA